MIQRQVLLSSPYIVLYNYRYLGSIQTVWNIKTQFFANEICSALGPGTWVSLGYAGCYFQDYYKAGEGVGQGLTKPPQNFSTFVKSPFWFSIHWVAINLWLFPRVLTVDADSFCLSFLFVWRVGLLELPTLPFLLMSVLYNKWILRLPWTSFIDDDPNISLDLTSVHPSFIEHG